MLTEENGAFEAAREKKFRRCLFSTQPADDSLPSKCTFSARDFPVTQEDTH